MIKIVGLRRRPIGPLTGDIMLDGLEVVGHVVERTVSGYTIKRLKSSNRSNLRLGVMTFVGPIPLPWRE